MLVFTTNDKRTIDVGSDRVWRSILYTMRKHIKDYKNNLQMADRFLCTGSCKSECAQETARQINLLRDAFSSIRPNLAVFDELDSSKKPPWGDIISPVTTSCANLYLTSDGKDLLFEMVSILTYASVIGVDVVADGLFTVYDV